MSEDTAPAEVETDQLDPNEPQQLEEILRRRAADAHTSEPQAPEEEAEPTPIRLNTMMDMLNEIIFPPEGSQVQIQSCTCGQPKIMSIGLGGPGPLLGKWIAFPYCINSMCPEKRRPQFVMPNGGGIPFDPRRLKG